MKPAALGLAACVALGGAALAVDNLPVVERFSDTTLFFDIKDNFTNITLSVSGPNGFHASASSKAGSPNIDLRRLGPLDDGTYTYQLTASTGERLIVRTPLNDGRDTTAAPLNTASASGIFAIKGGVIIKPSAPDGRRDKQ